MTKPTKAKPPANKAKPPVAKKSQSVKKPPAKAATKEQPTKKAAADEPGLAKFLYVFGQSDGGKPRGARFPVAQFGQIQEAVGELKLATCSDTSPRLTELGMKLPLGRVYARGKAFIPFIKKELLDQLRDAQYGPMSAPAGQEIAKEDVTPQQRGSCKPASTSGKPLALVSDAILDCSKRGSIILDAFAGSGTTLLAAEKTGRRGYGIELDPHYADLIIRRFAEVYSLRAIHADSNLDFEQVRARQTERNKNGQTGKTRAGKTNIRGNKTDRKTGLRSSTTGPRKKTNPEQR